MPDYDNPWKEILDEYLPAFLEFFFPVIHDEIDWPRGFESLDTELQQIVRDAELGRRRVDRLFKVWRLSGVEEWILIHIEIQSQEEVEFPLRMFVYHFRIFEKYGKTVVSLAVLGDERPSWRPNKFEYNNWGCKLGFEFPTVKLLDDAGREAELEASTNVFAAVVLAHLKSQQTRGDAQTRREWKMRIVRGLYGRGWSRVEIRKLFSFIDWIIELPAEIEKGFLAEVLEFEQENRMPYVTGADKYLADVAHELGLKKGVEQGMERGMERGMEKGRQETLLVAIELALELKFGAIGKDLMPEIRQLGDVDRLGAIHQAIRNAVSPDALRPLIASN